MRVEATVASFNRGSTFDPRVRSALTEAAGGGSTPELVCFAGHDAGIVAERRPAGMVLVRNRTGVSHAPDEDVDLEDAAAAATVAARHWRRSHDRRPAHHRGARDGQRPLARVSARPARARERPAPDAVPRRLLELA